MCHRGSAIPLLDLVDRRRAAALRDGSLELHEPVLVHGAERMAERGLDVGTALAAPPCGFEQRGRALVVTQREVALAEHEVEQRSLGLSLGGLALALEVADRAAHMLPLHDIRAAREQV